MDFSGSKPSNRIEDRTGDVYRNAQDWLNILGKNALEAQARRNNFDPHEAVRGLSPEDLRNLLFKKAMEEYGGGIIEDIPMVFPNKEGINTNNNWIPTRFNYLKALKGIRK